MRRRVLWAISSCFMASGATWLAATIWKTSELTFAAQLGPHVVAAALTGLTLARALDRRAIAIGFATGATLVWIVTQYVGFNIHDVAPRWQAPFDGGALAHYAKVAVLALPIAAVCAAPRLRGNPDHRVLWVWISVLMMLGTIIAPLAVVANDYVVPWTKVFFVLVGPFVAGAMTQVLKPYRAIWTCAGGALVFILLSLDRSLRAGSMDGNIAGPVLGIGFFMLLGALGALTGWRVFRNKDPRTPTAAPLPTASARQGDV